MQWEVIYHWTIGQSLWFVFFLLLRYYFTSEPWNGCFCEKLHHFPQCFEIQIRSQKGARRFPWLEEKQFSELHQTIRSVNPHWFRQMNWGAEVRPDQIPFALEFFSLKKIYNWKGGRTPPSRLQVSKCIWKARTQYIFSGLHTATQHHQSGDLPFLNATGSHPM